MTEIRKLPQQDKRVETGVTKFGDDWCGVFIRGDNANYYGFQLQLFLDQDPDIDALMKMNIKSLADLLRSCDEREIMENTND